MLTEMNNNGMFKGLMCGLVTFGFLRTGPRAVARYLNRSYDHSSHYNTRGNMHNTGTSSGGYAFDQPGMGAAAPRRPGLLFRTVRLGLDLAVSVSMAMYGSAYFTDKEKLMRDMSAIPLVQGRSLISDELCPDFIDVYRGIPQKTWKKYEGKSEALDAISGFVMNCMRRRVVEKEIMEQNRSFDPDAEQVEHVEIPSPGVSSDISVQVEWGDASDDVDVGVDGEDDFSDFGSELFGGSEEE